MSAFDTVADRLGAAVDVLVDARLACRKYRDEHLFNPGKRYDRLLDTEHAALVKVVAAYHYAEQVSASEYNGESTLAFEQREREAAAAAS